MIKKTYMLMNTTVDEHRCCMCSLETSRLHNITFLLDLVGFVALRPKSTAMVIAGRSVHLTTLFPGQA